MLYYYYSFGCIFCLNALNFDVHYHVQMYISLSLQQYKIQLPSTKEQKRNSNDRFQHCHLLCSLFLLVQFLPSLLHDSIYNLKDMVRAIQQSQSAGLNSFKLSCVIAAANPRHQGTPCIYRSTPSIRQMLIDTAIAKHTCTEQPMH